MEQEGDGRAGGGEGGDMNQQPQDLRLNMQQGDGQVHPQPQPPPLQPQKCPRCDSLNTKFCYYNNYSLSQPRYFCKTCRRYWTQGGTLRNVPVGGGCRKGKRTKISPSENSSRSNHPPPPPPLPQEVVPTQPNMAPIVRAKDPSAAMFSPPVAAVPSSITPFNYQGGGGGGYLPSLAGIHQSLNPSHPFDQSLNVVGGDHVLGGSNMALLSGFGVGPLGSQRQIRPSQISQMGGTGTGREMGVNSLYPAGHGLIPSSMANSGVAPRHDWPQSFFINANNRASDASLWSTISTTSAGGNSHGNVGAGSSLMQNQWPDLPGYGAPPQ